MSYSQFTLDILKEKFQLSLIEKSEIFVDITELEPSPFLKETLHFNLPLATAIGTEKARSELHLAPILVELKRKFLNHFSFYSGIEFNIEPEKGLNGVCDFLISHSSEQLYLTSPIMAIVEAKSWR